MIKFTMVSEGEKVTYKVDDCTDDDSWMNIVPHFQEFLLKCGYTFLDGFDMQEMLLKSHDKLVQKGKK
jgi:hypothetical protein